MVSHFDDKNLGFQKMTNKLLLTYTLCYNEEAGNRIFIIILASLSISHCRMNNKLNN